MKTALFFSFLFLSLSSLAQTQYSVKKGDTLLKIADRLLGKVNQKDPGRYALAQRIHHLNPDIKNPNEIEPGTMIILPISGTANMITAKSTALSELAPTTTTTLPSAEQKSEVETTITMTTVPTDQKTEEAPPAPHADEGAHHGNFILAQLRYNILDLTVIRESTKSKTSFTPELSLGLDLQYGWVVNNDFHLLFQAGATKTDFKDLSAGKTMNHKSETLTSFALGAAYELSSTLHFDFMLMMADRPFIIPTSDTTFELKKKQIPGAEINLSWDYYTTPSYLLGVSLIGEYVAKAEDAGITYKEAMEPLGALYWKSKNDHGLNYKAALTYKHGHQTTTLSEQKEDAYILGVAFIF